MSQFTPTEFIVTFGQVTPPNTLQLDPDEISALGSIDGVTTTRIVIAPEKMEELIETLQRNWQQYMTLLSQQEEGEE
jgi:hypothetical protein